MPGPTTATPARAIVLALAVAVAPSLACSPSAPPVTVHSAPRPAGPDVPRAERLDLGELATQLDSGPVDPISASLPDDARRTIQAHVALHVGAGARLAALREHFDQLDKYKRWTMQTILSPQPDGKYAFVELLYATVEAESLAGDRTAGDDADEARWFAYRLHGACESVGIVAAGTIELMRSAANGSQELEKQLGSLLGMSGFFSQLRERARALQRADAVAMLRRGKPAPAIPTLLEMLAGADERDRRYERALRLREEAIRRTPAATAKQWLYVSEAYACVLDAPRARAAFDRGAAAAGPDDADARVTAGRYVERVERFAALGGAQGTTYEARLERAQIELDLELLDQAQADFVALEKEAPGDARPVVGAVHASLADTTRDWSLDRLVAASDALEAVADGTHKEREYWEIALGVFGTAIFRQVLALAQRDLTTLRTYAMGRFTRMGQLAEGLRAYDPGHAAAVVFLADLLVDLAGVLADGKQEAAVAKLDASLAPAQALRVKFPDTLDATKLAVTCAYFSRQEQPAFDAVDAPLSAIARADAETCADRLAMHVGLAAAWNDASRLDAAGALAGDARAAPDADGALVTALEADADALRAVASQDAASWDRARERYEKALPGLTGAERTRVLTNLGVALARLGKADDARARWDEADDDDANAYAPRLDALAARAEGGDAGAAAGLDALDPDKDTPQTEQRLAWLAVLAQRAKQRTRAAAFARKLVEHRDAAVHWRDAPDRLAGANGVTLAQSFELGFGWKFSGAKLSFPSRIRVRPAVWLVIPAPLTLEEAKKLAKR